MTEHTEPVPGGKAPKGMSSKALAKAVFQAELPQEFVRALPAQSLYLAVKHNGLLSSGDLIEMAGLEQCRLMVDFDCWSADQFNEENFWEWLALPDAEGGLDLLRKLIKFIDLKLVALMISRHTDVVTCEEPTENPPGPGYHTADKGYTWVGVKIEDAHKHFLFSRFLAVIFETSAELFYQLLATPNVATESVLEEEAYQDRAKRLSGEGIPDSAAAFEANSPMNENQLAAEIKRHKKQAPIENIAAIEPLIYESRLIQPLGALFGEPALLETLQVELSRLMNAALVHWSIDYSDHDAVLLMADKVKGAINIGLETALRIAPLSLAELHSLLGLQDIYRSGLSKIMELHRLAMKLSEDQVRDKIYDNELLAVISAAREPFPGAPAFATTQAEAAPPQESEDAEAPTRMSGELKAICYTSEIEQLRSRLELAAKQLG